MTIEELDVLLEKAIKIQQQSGEFATHEKVLQTANELVKFVTGD